MKQLCIVEHLENGSTKICRIIGDGDEAFWQTQFEIAKQAIEFQESMSGLEHFNALHLNLLLNHCIKAGVITKQRISLDPLIIGIVEKEVAKTSWRLSRKKRLMNQFEYQYQKLSGTFQESLFSRFKSESFSWLKTTLYNRFPLPIRNFIQALKHLTK